MDGVDVPRDEAVAGVERDRVAVGAQGRFVPSGAITLVTLPTIGAPGGGFCCWETQLVYHRASGTIIFLRVNTNGPGPATLIELPIAVLRQLGLT